MANMENDPKAKEVLEQEVSVDELEAVSGGIYIPSEGSEASCLKNNCRDIYGGRGFPNCANTVEDGSHCDTNDACYNNAVVYHGFTSGCTISDCRKAWR